MYGLLEPDDDCEAAFIISNSSEYLEWVATNDTGGLLYDFPNVNLLYIQYRHDLTTDLVVVIRNNLDTAYTGKFSFS